VTEDLDYAPAQLRHGTAPDVMAAHATVALAAAAVSIAEQLEHGLSDVTDRLDEITAALENRA
jgi:hypothetical protein